MSEMEKFFKALNEGRVILEPPDPDRLGDSIGKFEAYSPNDADYFSLNARRVVVMPEKWGTDEYDPDAQ